MSPRLERVYFKAQRSQLIGGLNLYYVTAYCQCGDRVCSLSAFLINTICMVLFRLMTAEEEILFTDLGVCRFAKLRSTRPEYLSMYRNLIESLS